MRQHWETLWSFETARFTVRLDCTYDDDFDPHGDVDDDGETAENMGSGLWGAYVFRAVVALDGNDIASDVLGGSVYENVRDFVREHRAADPLERNCTVMRQARGDVVICHYFPDMVRNAISEARKEVERMQSIRLRAA